MRFVLFSFNFSHLPSISSSKYTTLHFLSLSLIPSSYTMQRYMYVGSHLICKCNHQLKYLCALPLSIYFVLGKKSFIHSFIQVCMVSWCEEEEPPIFFSSSVKPTQIVHFFSPQTNKGITEMDLSSSSSCYVREINYRH